MEPHKLDMPIRFRQCQQPKPAQIIVPKPSNRQNLGSVPPQASRRSRLQDQQRWGSPRERGSAHPHIRRTSGGSGRKPSAGMTMWANGGRFVQPLLQPGTPPARGRQCERGLHAACSYDVLDPRLRGEDNVSASRTRHLAPLCWIPGPAPKNHQKKH